MILVSFRRYDDQGPITFVADKIIAFTKNKLDPMNKTSIFCLSACEGNAEDEFVVATPYSVVIEKLENI